MVLSILSMGWEVLLQLQKKSHILDTNFLIDYPEHIEIT